MTGTISDHTYIRLTLGRVIMLCVLIVSGTVTTMAVYFKLNADLAVAKQTADTAQSAIECSKAERIETDKLLAQGLRDEVNAQTKFREHVIGVLGEIQGRLGMPVKPDPFVVKPTAHN